MTLIEIFTDHIRNRKSLKTYVEIRKTIPTRGEFNDETLIQAEEDLQRLKQEDEEIYELMYETLEAYYAQDAGHYVEYPINFVREILKIYQCNVPAKKVYEQYKRGLDHHIHDSC
ncbi:MAG: hypothetical protein K0U47_12265 [Epsilonproteobacteria bacterium]|nr:hypothetical protein [Campylobacterota bacterium]